MTRPTSVGLLVTLAAQTTRAAPFAGDWLYVGWSSRTLRATTDPAYSGARWSTTAHVVERAVAMRRPLGSHGYTTVNLDGGRGPTFDNAGRMSADLKRFLDGLAPLAVHLNGRGKAVGVYLNLGVTDDLARCGLTIPGTAANNRGIGFHPRRPATGSRPGCRPTVVDCSG